MNETPGFGTETAPDDTAGAAARVEAAMETAGLWLARLDSGSADQAAFERWRSADPAHAVAFARVTSAWGALDDSALVVAAPALHIKSFSRRAVLIAGLAVVATGLGVSNRVLARDRATTAVGERRIVRLAPDIRSEMNTDSRLSWRVRDKIEVWLERGEAAIAVAPGGSTVVMHAARSSWRLGPGRYNLRLDGARFELVVLDGVAEGNGARAVKGQQLTVRAGEVLTRKAAGNVLDKAAAWPHGEIVFDDAPLSEAVSEYNRYLERKLTIVDPAIARLRIGGRFTSADPSDFLAALQAVLPVKALRTEDGVLLIGAK